MQDQSNVNRRCCPACDGGGASDAPRRFELPVAPADLQSVITARGQIYTRYPSGRWGGANLGETLSWMELLQLSGGVTEYRSAP